MLEIAILAGGLSSRMGRTKSRLRLGSRTLAGHVRHNAAELKLPVRVIRKDLVPKCGPLGGVYSALKTTRAEAVLFLPCDTPFLSGALLRRFVAEFEGARALFGITQGKPGFPIILPRSLLPIVEQQIEAGAFALHDLARVTEAHLVPVPPDELFNINTPADLAEARTRYSSTQKRHKKSRIPRQERLVKRR